MNEEDGREEGDLMEMAPEDFIRGHGELVE